MTAFDVANIGAGPYGLAAGAQLASIRGLEVRVFGEPMESWKCHMPEGTGLPNPQSPEVPIHTTPPSKGTSFRANPKAPVWKLHVGKHT